MTVNQYDVVLVNLDPTIGSEIRKTRPCVIISPNEMNRHLRTLVIAPMTSKSHPYPTRVSVSHNKVDGFVVIDQVRTIDKRRIIKSLGKLTTDEIKAVKAVIQETYVD